MGKRILQVGFVFLVLISLIDLIIELVGIYGVIGILNGPRFAVMLAVSGGFLVMFLEERQLPDFISFILFFLLAILKTFFGGPIFGIVSAAIHLMFYIITAVRCFGRNNLLASAIILTALVNLLGSEILRNLSDLFDITALNYYSSDLTIVFHYLIFYLTDIMLSILLFSFVSQKSEE